MTNNKESTQEAKFANIHIIPFDLGFMFYDVYTPSYRGNYYLWQEFLKKLLKLQNGEEWQLLGETLKLDKDSVFYKEVNKKIWMHKKHKVWGKLWFSIDQNPDENTESEDYKPDLKKEDKSNTVECEFVPSKKLQTKPDKSKYLNTFEECLCEIKLDENLYCYILKSGLAVFVVGCFDKEGLNEYKNAFKGEGKLNEAVQMRLQNEIINRALLLDELKPKYESFLEFGHDKTNIFPFIKSKYRCTRIKNKIKSGWSKLIRKLRKIKVEQIEPPMNFYDLIEKDKDLINNSNIANGENLLDKVIPEQRHKMALFKMWCWKTIQDIVTDIKDTGGKSWSCKRPHSSKPIFNQLGFSLSANFIINKNFDSEKDQKMINYLQDRSISYENLGTSNAWTKANNHYNDVKYINTTDENINTQLEGDVINVPPLNIVKMHDYKISFSSNTVCIQPKKEIESMAEFLKSNEMTDLLFAEIDIITKWFNADNCIANDIEKEFTGIEGLQTIQGQIEYYSAELDNPTSSKIESLYLMYRKRIVETTKVKELYDSISQEIQILKSKKIEQVNNAANARDKFSRVIRLIIDLFIAGFTGAGMAKTIIDVKRGSYNWLEAFAFGAVIVVFVLGRVALAITDKVKDHKKQKDLKKR